MFSIKTKNLLNIILFFSIFALISAYFIQYVLGHQPCNLCLIERIPYVLIIIIIILNFFFNRYEKTFILLLFVIFIFSTLLSFYHFSIEQGFIKESLVCDLNSESNILNAEDILKDLKEKTISCKIVTFKIFNLSLATINTLLSLVLSIIMYRKFIKYEKK